MSKDTRQTGTKAASNAGKVLADPRSTETTLPGGPMRLAGEN